VAWSHHDHWSPNHHQERTDRASSRQGTCLLVSSGVFAAMLVCMGAGPQVAGLSADLCDADWPCVSGRE
jgi:hypothetical protein